ncbi:MAG: bifunctional chorismate mutase/prephenate dehydrogenase [Pasteurella sp.]|nr:bifunctional chorismate mutase/prephenate dehydrogenase [Pasteurella sp.]
MAQYTQKLNTLRQDIDDIDAELVNLLARRSKLTQQIGEIKTETGMPIYVPEREKSLIAARRVQANKSGISADLVEDLLHRIMRESYLTQNQGYRCINPDIKQVIVVGGAGSLGSLLVDLFERSNYSVAIIEKEDWQNPTTNTLFARADLVLIAVPIAITEKVIQQLPPLPKHCILADITSVKEKPLQAMLAQHSGPVVGLHPMFGGDSPGMIKQVVIVCDGRGETKYEWFIEQMKIWGATIHHSQVQEHDQAMAFIQVMRHFNTFVYGLHLQQENPNLNTLTTFSSPIYRLEFTMVGRLFAQSPELYADIIFNNPENITLLRHFQSCFAQSIKLLESGDKAGFIQSFKEVADWFGDYAQKCLVESKQLLLKADDKEILRKSE